MPSTSVMSFEIIVEANTDPTATTNTKSNALSLERVRLPDTRNSTISAEKPTIESVSVLTTLYQLSKKKGGCGITGRCMGVHSNMVGIDGYLRRDRASRW